MWSVGSLIFIWKSQKAAKEAFVDNKQVIRKYHGFIEADKLLESKKAKWLGNLDTLEQDVQREIESFKVRSFLSEQERQSEIARIKGLQQNFLEYKKSIESRLADEEMEMTESVINQLDGYIHEFGAANDYKMIHGVTDMGNILYADSATDVTASLIDYVNKRYDGI